MGLLFLILLAACGREAEPAAGSAPVSEEAAAASGNSAAKGDPAIKGTPGAVAIGDGKDAGESVTDVTLSTSGGFPIYYTTDSGDPTLDSELYSGPLTLTPSRPFLSLRENYKMMAPGVYAMETEGYPAAVVLKAAAISPDGRRGPIAVRTFFPGLDLNELFPGAPVISLVTDPDNLLDYDRGIMCEGRVYDEWLGTEDSAEVLEARLWWWIKANYMERGPEWERPAHVELFESGTSDAAVSEGCGIRLHGAVSRQFLQKAFNLYFREAYGSKKLKYELIPAAISETAGETIDIYKSVALDNGGNAAKTEKYRDSLMHDLAGEAGLNVSRLASRPAALFLNGEYWGTYLIQERYSKQYFAGHYGVDKNNVVVFKEEKLDEGRADDAALFKEYMQFKDVDLADPAAWESFERTVDVPSMIDYYAYEIYICNADWSHNKNISMWRVRVPDGSSQWADGRWRFNLMDLEFSAGLYGSMDDAADRDSFEAAKEHHPVFKAALQNPQFRRAFAERMAFLADELAYETVSPKIDRYAATFKPIEVLSSSRFHYIPKLEESDYGEISIDERHIRRFFDKRSAFVREVIVPEILEAGEELP